MKKAWLLLSAFALAACAPQVTTKVDSGLSPDNPYATYTGPRAKVVVASFPCKAEKCGPGVDSSQVGAAVLGKLFGIEVSTNKGDVGAGIADMLTTALINTNHFIVYERSILDQLQKESQIGNQAQQLQGAEILITGTITAFEPDAGGTRGGGGGLLGGLLGAVAGGQKKAYVAVDFRAVDVRTGAVVAAFRVEGEASDTDFGGLLGALVPGAALGGALTQYQKTPMGKALAVMVGKAVEELIRRIPSSYFKYGPDGQPLPQPAK